MTFSIVIYPLWAACFQFRFAAHKKSQFVGRMLGMQLALPDSTTFCFYTALFLGKTMYFFIYLPIFPLYSSFSLFFLPILFTFQFIYALLFLNSINFQIKEASLRIKKTF